MAKITPFTAEQFVGTEHYSAKQKAEFGNRLASFVAGGFQPHAFTDIIYKNLSNTFGHIAHFNREGFYATWFSTPAKQASFIKYTLEYKVSGDPKHGFSDVCEAFQGWLRDQNIQVKVEDSAATAFLYAYLDDTADGAIRILGGEKTPETVNTVIDQSVAFLGKFHAGQLDPDKVAAVRERLVRKHTVQAIEYKLADISGGANSFGHYGHIFVSRDGEVWQATKARIHGGLKVGESITVPLVDGRPNWNAVGYEVPEKMKKATADQIARVWPG